MPDIQASVGQGGKNDQSDVLIVQKLLNEHVQALGLKRLKQDGLIGINTIGAIRKYQADVMGSKNPDGRIDVGGRTWRSLQSKAGVASAQPAKPAAPAAKPAASGAKWTWDQSAGSLAFEGQVIAFGYAGKGRGKNNPDLQHVQKTGPIPRGLWRMTARINSPNTGPRTIVLEPEPGTETHGRSLFRVHGDNSTHTASEGCIILGPLVRNRMWTSRNEAPLIEVVK